jgi:hypothetical protein
MGDPRPGERVDFDFDGALVLARKLWAMSIDLREEDEGRGTDAEGARLKWKGAYATQFDSRRSTEHTSRINAAAGLREDARSWAQAWATALDQQNKNNRAQAVQDARDDRGFFERGWDATLGEDDSESEVAQVPEVPVPQPPGFAPTATETTY